MSESKSPEVLPLSGIPYEHCHATKEELREEGHRLADACPACATYGTRCLVAAHPNAASPASARPDPVMEAIFEKMTIQEQLAQQQAEFAQQQAQQMNTLLKRTPDIKEPTGSELNTHAYEEFRTAMLPLENWNSVPFESTTVAAAMRIVETFSEAILADFNKKNVKEIEFVQPKSLQLMESFLQLGPLKEKAFMKKEAYYRTVQYKISGRADKVVRINNTVHDLMSFEDKGMKNSFISEGTRNKDVAQALSQMHGFTEKMNSFVEPRLRKFVQSFCGILTTGLEWIFIRMLWLEGRYVSEHTTPICVITKTDGINLESVEIVAKLILQSLSVAEELRQQHQRACSSGPSSRLGMIYEDMPSRGDGAAGDDKGGYEKKPRPRRNQNSKKAKPSSQNLSNADSHGGKTVRSFGDHLTLNDLNLRFHSTPKAFKRLMP